MTVWRLHTRTAWSDGDIAHYCVENNVAAVGWCFSLIYTEENPELEEKIKNIKTFSDYWELAVDNFDYNSVCSVWRLAENVKPSDIIWIHSKDGCFYVAKVSENSKWQFCFEARDKDASNQITNIKWHEVKDELIPTRIREAFKRGFTLQRIHSKEVETFSEGLFTEADSSSVNIQQGDKKNDEYQNLYEALFKLDSPVDIEAGLKSGALVSSQAAACRDYEKSKFRLMYVGRDLGGWNKLKGNNARELAEAVLADESPEEFLHYAVHDPQFRDESGKLTYSIRKSPFWQLCKEIMTQAGEGENWAERIVWSNVYKVTYDGISVSWPLMDETFKACLDILKYELESFKPKHVVFVTGASHFLPKDLGDSFVPVCSPERNPADNAFGVVSKGIYTDKSGHKVKIVAVNRPEHKNDSIEEKARKIMEAFNSL